MGNLDRPNMTEQELFEYLRYDMELPVTRRMIKDAELAASAAHSGEALEWSAAEEDIIGMIGQAVDWREELSAAYRAAEGIGTRLKIATEIRLTEQAIARLLKQVSTEVPAPMLVTSMKPQRAANSRWDRERLKNSAN
jgi:hypothetical protein